MATIEREGLGAESETRRLVSKKGLGEGRRRPMESWEESEVIAMDDWLDEQQSVGVGGVCSR